MLRCIRLRFASLYILRTICYTVANGTGINRKVCDRMEMNMGRMIRKLRKERNLTQEELAEQLNITPQAVSRWESGAGLPDISQIVPLANVFGVTTDVLFGRDGMDGEEVIKSFIRDTEKKICNLPEGISSFAWQKECCEDVQKMLEVYPNNYELLAYSLGHIDGLLDEYKESDEMKDKTEEIQKWENELFRQANVILNHCTDSRYLNSANMWMANHFRRARNFRKMLEYAEKLTVFNPYAEGGYWKALAYESLGREEDSRRQHAENIINALDYLESELLLIGNSWEKEGKFEEAYSCYRLYPDIYDLMVGEREDEINFSILWYDQCALSSMRLNRPDEAMDWLEKMVRHERIADRNHNVITETKLPYLYGQTRHYWSTSPRRTDTLLPILAWDIFDSIRETDRFRAILADAEAFEKGE